MRPLQAIAFGIALALAGPLVAYDEPKVAAVQFDPGGVVLEDAVAERLPRLLVGLATDFANTTDEQRARCLVIALRLDPDNAAAQAANTALLTGVAPPVQGLKVRQNAAVSELWTITSGIHAHAVTEDERALARYLTGVVLAFADKSDPRFARARKILGKDGPALWRDVVSG